MPEISRFFGIVIQMYYRDHQPPHFHVRYGGQRALMAIDTLTLIRGRLLIKMNCGPTEGALGGWKP